MSEALQTAKELILRVRQGYDEADSFLLASRVEAVLALHVEEKWEDMLGGSPVTTGRCDECDNPWPCHTVRILDGEKP